MKLQTPSKFRPTSIALSNKVSTAVLASASQRTIIIPFVDGLPPYVSCFLQPGASGVALLFKIDSFNLEDDTDFQNFLDDLNECLTASYDLLIIDVQQNGGGSHFFSCRCRGCLKSIHHLASVHRPGYGRLCRIVTHLCAFLLSRYAEHAICPASVFTSESLHLCAAALRHRPTAQACLRLRSRGFALYARSVQCGRELHILRFATRHAAIAPTWQLFLRADRGLDAGRRRRQSLATLRHRLAAI